MLCLRTNEFQQFVTTRTFSNLHRGCVLRQLFWDCSESFALAANNNTRVACRTVTWYWASGAWSKSGDNTGRKQKIINQSHLTLRWNSIQCFHTSMVCHSKWQQHMILVSASTRARRRFGFQHGRIVLSPYLCFASWITLVVLVVFFTALR